MRPSEDQLDREEQRLESKFDEDAERQWVARRHFPHLSRSVAPRESDEYPTYWEDA